MSIKTTASIGEALDHIFKYGSKHSEAIVAEDQNAIDIFLKNVDAAAVYANASTAFTDGDNLGLARKSVSAPRNCMPVDQWPSGR